jgi:hypothetical protein
MKDQWQAELGQRAHQRRKLEQFYRVLSPEPRFGDLAVANRLVLMRQQHDKRRIN